MDSGSLVALAGLALSALALYLTYRDKAHERTAAYRHSLYSKHLEAYVELIQAAADVQYAATDFVNIWALRSASQERWWALFGALEEKMDRYGDVRQRWLVILPSRVQERLDEFTKLVWEECLYQGEMVSPDEMVTGKVHIGLMNDIETSYRKIVQATRESLGTDPLSEETLKHLGMTRQQLEAHRARRIAENGDSRMVEPRQYPG